MQHRSLTMVRAIAVALLLATLSTPGCFRSSELANIRRDLESQLPDASFKRNVELSFGPMVITLARVVTHFVPGADEARPWLRDLSRVQVAVYDAHVGEFTKLRMPERLQSLIDDGWETAVRVRDEREAVWVLYRPDGDKVREVFVVVLNENELVMVKARGRLEKLMATALRESHRTRGFMAEFGS